MSLKLPLNRQDLVDLANRICDLASSMGATAAETSLSVNTGMAVNVRLGEVETLEYQRDRGIGVTVYFDQCKGSASSSDFSDEALHKSVSKACSIARFTAADPAAGLPLEADMATDLMDLQLYHPWDITPSEAIELAQTCETAARDADVRIRNSEGASVNSHRTTRVYGNSHGFADGFSMTSHSVSCAVLAADDDGAMERDYWYSSVRDPGEMESAVAVGREAARRAVARLGAKKIPTCTAPVLFPAILARSLVGHFLGAISGASQYRKTTFLLDAKGTRIFPKFVNIVEDPHIPKAFGSVPMDAEGVTTRRRDLVSDGVLLDYVMSSYSARRLGLKTTGNAGGIHNMLVASGEHDFDGLLQQMNTGLLLTELIGQGVNSTTGDYSRGAAGFWVENGAIAYPVHEITIAGNLLDMYQRLVGIGTDIDTRTKIRCGSMLLDDLTIAGN
ncbi:MAG: metalloprotease PmbA [Gammaproteobacteria bacterium]|nr:metalloprotease PmbA [Gammaproteobacteria bacterium]